MGVPTKAKPNRFLRRKALGRGELIFREGDIGDCAYLIERGEVVVKKATADGTFITLKHLGNGEILGEMALVDGLPRSASAIAVSEAILTVISKADFQKLMDHCPAGIVGILKSLIARLRGADCALAGAAHGAPDHFDAEPPYSAGGTQPVTHPI